MSHIVANSTLSTRPRLDKYGYNCIGKHIGMVLFVCAPLFIGAGSLNWSGAWVFTLVTLVGWVVLSFVLARVNPELLNQRGQRMKALTGTKWWDWMIMSAYAVLLIVTPLIAGLDHRHTWSTPASNGVKFVGIFVLAASFIPLTSCPASGLRRCDFAVHLCSVSTRNRCRVDTGAAGYVFVRMPHRTGRSHAQGRTAGLCGFCTTYALLADSWHVVTYHALYYQVGDSTELTTRSNEVSFQAFGSPSGSTWVKTVVVDSASRMRCSTCSARSCP